MRHFQLARRAGVPTAVVALGLLVATPARADVTVSPTSAAQGSGENLTLRVTNTGTQPVATITVRLPADTPIAEVYPLSVDNWAPKIEPRTLSTPLETIHGGTPVTETASAITWIAMPGKNLAPGGSADVALAVGPLPTVSSLRLAVETKYADGKPGPVMPPATLALTAPQPGQVPPAHHGATGGGATTTEDQLFADAVRDAERGSSVWSIGGWVVAGLVLLGAAVMMLRARHRRTDDDDEPDDDGKTDETAGEEPKEPVAAGSSKWAFKG
ncbi:MAG: DUF1775 domain-containing protein [Actinoplanes sp.]